MYKSARPHSKTTDYLNKKSRLSHIDTICQYLKIDFYTLQVISTKSAIKDYSTNRRLLNRAAMTKSAGRLSDAVATKAHSAESTSRAATSYQSQSGTSHLT